MRIETLAPGRSPLAFVSDWGGLGALLGVKVRRMAHALKFRDEMQSRISLGERTVYNSAPSLRRVQRRIGVLVDRLFETLPGTGCAIAYRKGMRAVDKVGELAGGGGTLVTLDIRKYFDHVTLAHIEDAVARCGLPRRGARLVARYCVVRRRTRNGLVQTLQQGSPASPAVSNLVGHFRIDVPVMAVLDDMFPGSARYLRYCDNLCIRTDERLTPERREELKRRIREALAESGFRTHKWACVSDVHPMMRQSFLGIVLNGEARAGRRETDNLAATLFNWCLNGGNIEARRYLAMQGLEPRAFDCDEVLRISVLTHLEARARYVATISEKQGLRLRKLAAAAHECGDWARGRDIPDLLDAVRRYRNRSETLEDYVGRVRGAVSAARAA